MVDWNTKGYTNKQDETIRILRENVKDLEGQLNVARKKIHGLNAKIAAAEDAAIQAKIHHDQVMADVLEMNVPVTTLANTIQLGGVMDGKHTIDVGMLEKPLLMEMIMLIGDNAGVNYDSGLTDAPDNTTIYTIIEAVRKEMQEKINKTEEVSEEPEQEEIEEKPKSGLMARR